MNIKPRINARKIVFSYLYEKFFVEYFSSKKTALDQVLDVERDMYYTDPDANQKDELHQKLKDFYKKEDREEDVTYIVDNAFSKEKADGIDFDYIKVILVNYDKYLDAVKNLVDQNTMTFKYDEMDIIDKIIFIIGYTEHKELDTDPKIILNEMIELGKRYGDAGSYKLINGIMYKMLQD